MPTWWKAGFRMLQAWLTVAEQTTGRNVVKTGYAPVDGLKMYYEIRGEGEPLVLVHGGVVGITMFGGNVDALAKGREVIAVFEDRADAKLSYMMWLEWRDGRISFIRDYRYVRYVAADAELVRAPDTKPEGGGAAH